jgi:multidrug resistance efflux pump
MQKEREAEIEREMFTITAPVNGTVEAILVQAGGAVTTPLGQGVIRMIPDKNQESSGSRGF